VCFGLTRKKWSYIDGRGKMKAYWSDGPTRGRGSSKQFLTQGITFTPKKEVGNSLLERWTRKRNYFALQYVSFVISGDQLIDVKYITIFLLYNLFLLFLSFSLDNEKKEILLWIPLVN
jgi:hypothetical protein